MFIAFFMCVSSSLSLCAISSASTSSITYQVYMNGMDLDGRRGPVVGH